MDQLYQYVFEAVPDGILCVDGKGVIVHANPMAEQLFDYPSHELIGLTVEDLIPSRLRESHLKHRQKFAATPRLRPMGTGLMLKALRKDGSEIDVEINLSPLNVGDQRLTIAVVRDVSVQRRAQEALRVAHEELRAIEQHRIEEQLKKAEELLEHAESLRSLGQMATGIAHDLKNLLNPILLHVQILERTLSKEVNPASSESIRSIKGLIQRGVEIIDRLRSFSRQNLASNTEPVQLDWIAKEAAEICRPRLANALRRSVELKIETGHTPTIQANKSELITAVVNLVVNAFEAMGEQKGMITVRTGCDATWNFISVEDNGPGIAPEVRTHIFEPFFTTKGEQGTGMGLAMVFATVTRHLGEVKVDTEVGRGTRFTLYFPIAGDRVSDISELKTHLDEEQSAAATN